MEITFTNPIYLWMLLALPFLFLIHFFSLKYIKRKGIQFANFEALKRVTGGRIVSYNIPLIVLRTLTLLFLVFSAAGATVWIIGLTSDYNYVLALDASGSMLSDDFSPNRFDAAKQAAILFVDTLKAQGKIGVVSFSGITFMDGILNENRMETKQVIRNLQIRSMHGTAIGQALKTAQNLLVTEEKSRTIILLTDGRENVASEDDLRLLMEDLQKEHIVVHTIGIGTEEGGQLPGLEAISMLDDTLLFRIANATGGTYSRATNNQELVDSYTELAHVEEALIPIKLRFPFLTAVFILLFSEWALINTRYRSIP